MQNELLFQIFIKNLSSPGVAHTTRAISHERGCQYYYSIWKTHFSL